jgi:hypothetical protein
MYQPAVYLIPDCSGRASCFQSGVLRLGHQTRPWPLSGMSKSPKAGLLKQVLVLLVPGPAASVVVKCYLQCWGALA